MPMLTVGMAMCVHCTVHSTAYFGLTICKPIIIGLDYHWLPFLMRRYFSHLKFDSNNSFAVRFPCSITRALCPSIRARMHGRFWAKSRLIILMNVPASSLSDTYKWLI